jgi:hypothetical protein
MRRVLFLAALLLGEAAALACSCAPPQGEAERRQIARRIAIGAAVIAEVVEAEPMDWRKGQGELVRPLRLFVGEPRDGYRLERGFSRDAKGRALLSATSCDVHFGKAPAIAVLYPADYKWPEAEALASELAAAEGAADAECRAARVAVAGEALRTRAGSGGYRDAGTCDTIFIAEPENLRMVLDEARRLGRAVHQGPPVR